MCSIHNPLAERILLTGNVRYPRGCNSPTLVLPQCCAPRSLGGCELNVVPRCGSFKVPILRDFGGVRGSILVVSLESCIR